MTDFRRDGDKYSIPIPADDDGMTGRECPISTCLGYFKLQLGTGLKGENLPCHCPYCGHTAGQDQFFTQEQLEYAKSVVANAITSDLIRKLKKNGFSHKPIGPLGIGFSLKVTGSPAPIRRYREKQLETIIICNNCTLRYAIYGVFGFCPDCGVHNSQQILEKNLELATKELALAETAEAALAEYLTADALENAVSAFDGFGREWARIHSSKATAPTKAEALSFRNLMGAKKRVYELFAVDLAEDLAPSEWDAACRGFQKRHLFAHKMGVVDQAYVDATGDPLAVIGRKVAMDKAEVAELIELIRRMGSRLANGV